MLAEVEIVVNHRNLAVARDDVGRPRGQPGMFGPGHVISFLGGWRGGGDREGIAAFLDRKALQRRQVVGGEADNLGPGALEVGGRVTERVRFERTAFGEGLGEEIEHYRALFELGLQMELERLSTECAGG